MQGNLASSSSCSVCWLYTTCQCKLGDAHWRRLAMPVISWMLAAGWGFKMAGSMHSHCQTSVPALTTCQGAQLPIFYVRH